MELQLSWGVRATSFIADNGSRGAEELSDILDICKRFQKLTPGNLMISASKFWEDAAVPYAKCWSSFVAIGIKPLSFTSSHIHFGS